MRSRAPSAACNSSSRTPTRHVRNSPGAGSMSARCRSFRGAASCSSPTPTATAGPCRSSCPGRLAGMQSPQAPTFADVLAARKRIAPYLRPTPLYPYGALSSLVGTEVWVKHENHQPVGAFKVRGGVNLLAQLSPEERQRGVIAASTGNHGQSVAYAARLFGARAIICVPEDANPVKVESMRSLGAEIIFHGRDFDEAREHCEEIAEEQGFRYIHSGDEPLLIAGIATHTLEILEERPDIEVIVVPVGGGSGAAGACLAAKAINPQVEV